MSNENDSNPYAGQAGAGGYSQSTSVAASVGAQPAPAQNSANFNGQIASAPANSGDIIKDVTTQSFMADVIEASNIAPVLVDFWAPWCGPCKQLGPIIEKAVTDAGGVITLCKMDVEKYPDISQQMGIQSIPAVVAFINGRPADAFMGAKSEAEVREFIDKIVAKAPERPGDPLAEALDQANDLVAAGDHGAAAELYSRVLEAESGNLDAYAGLAQCYIAVGEIDAAAGLIEQLPPEHLEKEPLAAVAKAIELARQGAGLGELSALQEAADANPKDHQACFDYALALNAAGEREQAAEQLLSIIRKDRKWEDDGARAKLLEFFESWGNVDQATQSARRALSSILFS